MNTQQTILKINTSGRNTYEVTDLINTKLRSNHMKAGLCHIFIQHTSASLIINENADPTVRQDFESFFNNVVPENEPYYKHTLEGSDDLPAHLKASLLVVSQLTYFKWQAQYRDLTRNLSL